MKLIKAGFKDPLFYLVLLDYIFTRVIISTGLGIEYNPIVKYLGNTWAIIISLFIYFVLIPKKGNKLIRFPLIAYFIRLNIHHILIIAGIS